MKSLRFSSQFGICTKNHFDQRIRWPCGLSRGGINSAFSNLCHLLRHFDSPLPCLHEAARAGVGTHEVVVAFAADWNVDADGWDVRDVQNIRAACQRTFFFRRDLEKEKKTVEVQREKTIKKNNVAISMAIGLSCSRHCLMVVKRFDLRLAHHYTR